MSPDKDQPSELPEMQEPSEETQGTVISISRARLRFRKKAKIAMEAKKHGLSALHSLADANPDIGKTLQTCIVLGINTDPLETALSDEADCSLFYELMCDYLDAIKTALLAGSDLGKRAVFIGKDSAITRCATEFALELIKNPEKMRKVAPLIVRLDGWIRQKLAEEA